MGVNVWMWGPSTWRLMFAVAVLVDIFGAPFVAVWGPKFIRALCNSTPCPLCLRSVAKFLPDVERARGETIAQAAKRGHLIDFLHDLKTRVNEKLHAQHLREHAAMLSGSSVTFNANTKSCSIPARTISLKNLKMRLKMKRSHFDAEDVLTVLHALRLDSRSEMRANQHIILQGLALLLSVYSRMRSGKCPSRRKERSELQDMAWVMQKMMRQKERVARMLSKPAGFPAIVGGIHRYMSARWPGERQREGETSEQHVARLNSRFSAMQVGVVCAKETCSA